MIHCLYILLFSATLEEVKLNPKGVETVSQTHTNIGHGRPTNTLQRTVSRGSEKVYIYIYTHCILTMT